MRLQDFVSETLLQIAAGIKNAQDKNSSGGVLGAGTVYTGIGGEQIYQSEVHFDLELQADETDVEKTGLSIAFGGVSFSKDGKSDTSATKNKTHVSFSVLVQWPVQP